MTFQHGLATSFSYPDKDGRAVMIDFKSYKYKRVVRSAMGGEVIAFSDLLDRAAKLSSELGEGSRTSEKIMMLDIAAAREGFRDKTISDIGFVRSASNLADGLTKPMSQAALQSVVSTGVLSLTPEQRIIRN
eukprot:IDg22337t1